MTAAVATQTSPAFRRARQGFAGYDWANSGYITVVTTAVGGPFLDHLATTGKPLSLWGVTLMPSLALPATLILAVLVQVVLLPLLGRAVDRGKDPASLIRRFAVAGGLSAIVLAVSPSWHVAALSTAAATVCFGAAMVPYNSLLPRLAPGTAADTLSARAFATGYIGGGLLLALSLVLLTVAPFGLGQALLVRVAIAAAGLWWAGFALLACRAMADLPPLSEADQSPERVGIVSLLRDLPQLRIAIVVSLLLGDAVGAVVALSATVLTHELWTAKGLAASDATATLLTMVLLIQVLAAPAALAVGRLAKKVGTKPVLLGCLVGWVAVLANAFLGLKEVKDVWVLAVGVAAVLGGSQTLARSLVSQCTPAGNAGAVFALTQLAERGTAWMGPLIFGVVVATTGSYRGALASLLVLFLAAGLALSRSRPAVGVAAAQSYDPEVVYQARRLALPDAQVPTSRGRSLYRLIAGLLAGLLGTAVQLRLRPSNRLPAGPVVVLVNHRSVLDGPLLAVIGCRLGRQLRMLTTAGVLTAPVVGPVLLSAGMIPVKRGTQAARSALDGAALLLGAGEAVALFPEGRIGTTGDPFPQPLKSGAGRLALLTGAPVVLIGISGADQVIPAGARKPASWPGSRRHRITARTSAPIDLAALLGLPPGPVAVVSDELASAAAALLHELLTAQVRLAIGGALDEAVPVAARRS